VKNSSSLPAPAAAVLTPPERDPGRLGPSLAAGLLVLRAGRAAIRGAVARRGAPQPVPFLGGLAGFPDAEVVVPELGP
jgi:hypothetical protein